MLKSILSLNGVKELSRNVQSSVRGNGATHIPSPHAKCGEDSCTICVEGAPILMDC